MKKLIISTLLILLSFNSLAQDLDSMKIEAQKIVDLTMKSNFEEILDFTYPKIFEIVTKEQMKEVLIKTFNGDENIKIKIIPVNPEFEYGEILKIDNSSYCLITHNLSMQMTLKEIEKEDVEMYLDIFKASMKAKNISFDEKTKAFTIELRSTMIAIFDSYTKGKWKFLNKSKNTAMFTKLLGEAAVNKLGL